MSAMDQPGGRAPLPTLPTGWRHAGIVERIARQPRERRETILAGAFALVAALWAPLGVLAFLSRNGLLFGLLSLVAVTAAVAPRPATSQVPAALEGLRPALASMREHAESLLGGLRGAARRATPHVRAAVNRIGPHLRDAWHWVAARLREAGHTVSARLRTADQRISAAVRSGLEDLRTSGGRDHSTPSSVR